VLAHLDAYGWAGPWYGRRGFDSLVQMSCGIAAAGAAAAGVERPVPLPVQALDHATGYLLAAAIGVALVRRVTTGETSEIHTSLLSTADLLVGHPAAGGSGGGGPQWTEADTEPVDTAWGPARRVPPPVRVSGVDHGWGIPAGPLGRDRPSWAQR
jgi:crotonobetainyl-CoA:carnitine CoA-transferase CaiB-like acyl-CoA transferase